MLTLLEEVVLLAVDEKTGELTSSRECWTEYALAAAVLFDLALDGVADESKARLLLSQVCQSQPEFERAMQAWRLSR